MRERGVVVLCSALALSACAESPTEPAPDVPSFDTLVVTVSATLALGRTVRPVFAIGRRGYYGLAYSDFPELAREVRFESSDPRIATIGADGSIRASALGNATLTASLAGKRTALPIDVISGLPVTYLYGTEGVQVMGVNDAGDVIGIRRDQTNILIRQETTRDIGACVPRAINNAGQIACTVGVPGTCCARRPGILTNGSLTVISDTSGQSTGITELGAVFGLVGNSPCCQQIFVWTPGGLTYPFKEGRATWGGETFAVNSALNGVAVLRLALYPTSYIVRSSTSTVLSPLNGRWSDARGINDADDVVGTSEHFRDTGEDVGGLATVWLSANQWKPEMPGYRSSDASGISETGQVVGSGRDGAYLWRRGRYTILSDAVLDPGWTLTTATAISRGGKIAAIGQHTSGTRGVVVINAAAAP